MYAGVILSRVWSSLEKGRTKAAGWICPGKVEFAMPWLQACELDPKDCVLSSLAPAILLMVIGVCKSEKSAFRGTPIPGLSPVRVL
jgi:hypothetical protein